MQASDHKHYRAENSGRNGKKGDLVPVAALLRLVARLLLRQPHGGHLRYTKVTVNMKTAYIMISKYQR